METLVTLKSQTFGLRTTIVKRVTRALCPTLYTTINFYPQLRPALAYVKEHSTGKLKGVEIGVQRGLNSLQILSYMDIEALYAVDAYPSYWETIDGQQKLMSYSNYKKEALSRLAKFRNVNFIIKDSIAAVSEVPNDLDFVYLDGDHNYPFVLKEIESYYPKIKKGGVLGGHDINLIGVLKSVSDFLESKNLTEKLHCSDIDWWIVKEE